MHVNLNVKIHGGTFSVYVHYGIPQCLHRIIIIVKMEHKLTKCLLQEYIHTDMNTYVCLSKYKKYILCTDFKFGILNLKIFMIIMILCKHYGAP